MPSNVFARALRGCCTARSAIPDEQESLVLLDRVGARREGRACYNWSQLAENDSAELAGKKTIWALR